MYTLQILDFMLFFRVYSFTSNCVLLLFINRLLKENRATGILENFEEGDKYVEHLLKKYVHNKSPEIMPSINKYFIESK